MKRLCILCEDSVIDLARKNTEVGLGSSEPVALSPWKTKFGMTAETPRFLSIPLSESGKFPATHWFCFMTATDEMFEKMKSIQEHSIIEDSGPKEFLEKWNLQIIK